MNIQQYKIVRSWIPTTNIDWNLICANPQAMHIIEFCLMPDTLKTPEEAEMYNPDKINWEQLSENYAAIHLLEANPDKIVWRDLARNPNAMHLLLPMISKKCIDADKELKELYSTPRYDWPYDLDNHLIVELPIYCKYRRNIKMLHFSNFMLNPAAIPFLMRHPRFIRWRYIHYNHYGQIILDAFGIEDTNYHTMAKNAWNFIQEHLDDPEQWHAFCDTFSAYSSDPRVLKFLYDEQRINWRSLSANTSAAAIALLADNYDHPDICWGRLSANPAALDILEAHPEHICHGFIWANPNIFTYDYQLMKTHKEPFKEALMQYLYHPERIQKVIEHADTDDQDLQVLDEYLL